MPSATVENYLKGLLAEEQTVGDGTLVPMGRLAERMAVVPGTATSMVKTLHEGGLVEYEPRGGVRLTVRGRALALRVLRRHRILEAFLVDVLGMDWAEVHDEAEELEHVVSDKLLERIDQLLGRPVVDPHGDPIPSARATQEPSGVATRSLELLDPGERAVVVRVVDQDARFLRFVQTYGLTPGTAVLVTQRDLVADSVTVQGSADAVTLGTSAAAKILVEA